MPSRFSALTTAVKEWFQIHGKVVFTFAVFNILLIVFCVVYWGVGLPMYPLNTLDITTTATPNWFHGSNVLDGFHADLSKIVSDFYIMQWCIFSLAVYMVYILRDMYYAQISALFQVYEEIERSNGILRDMYSSQLQSQRLLIEGVEDLNRIYNLINFEPEALTRVVQGVKDNIDEKCDGFEDLLRKIIRIMPEHPIDIRDAVYSFQDMTEDLLSKIKREIRMLRIDSANDGEVKEEMVELSASSAEASGAEESEVPVVPTITPRQKRGRKPNVSGSSSSSSSSSTTRPLLSSTRLGSRRANEMIQQATQ